MCQTLKRTLQNSAALDALRNEPDTLRSLAKHMGSSKLFKSGRSPSFGDRLVKHRRSRLDVTPDETLCPLDALLQGRDALFIAFNPQ